MKIATPYPVEKQALIAYLQAAFPQCEVGPRMSYISVAKSAMVGTNVVIRKDKVIVVGNFGSMGGQIGFAVALVLLGFLIPLIIYLVAFRSKQTELEKQVGAVVQQYVTQPAAAPHQQQQMHPGYPPQGHAPAGY